MKSEEAIKAIKNNWPDERYTMLREALEMAIDSLSNAPAERWVSVEERLPDHKKDVFVLDINKKSVSIGKYLNHGEDISLPFPWATMHIEIFNNYTVTHWTEIPKPPSEGKGEEGK